MKPIRFATIGVGGFGGSHLGAIRVLEQEGIGQLVAVAENNIEANRDTLNKLSSRHIRHYSDFQELLQTEKTVDVVSIPTGIPYHAPMTIAALHAGFHVLCEKPPAATIQDLDTMIEAQEKSGKECAIGFQLLSGLGFRQLNESIKNGDLGEIEAVIGVGRWKRLDSYYERNQWAGRLKLGDRWVLDGPILNPLSHYLNNVLFLASSEMGRAGVPRWVQAELYKAHSIESEDTSCLTAELENGVRVYFYVTLCDREGGETYIQVCGPRAEARWDGSTDQVTLTCRDSDSKDTVTPRAADFTAQPGSTREVFRNLSRFLLGEVDKLYCPVVETRPYQMTANAAFESSRAVHPVHPQYVIREPQGDSVATFITGLEETLEQAVVGKKLFSDLGVPWAMRTEPFAVHGYSHFPQQFSTTVNPDR